MRARYKVVALVLLVSLLTVGCGAGQPTDPQVPLAATPLAMVATNTPIQPTATPSPAQATLGDTVTRPTDGALMVYVPGGTFQMGSTQAQIAQALKLCDPFVESGECPKALFDDETPQHTVTLDGFWIDQTEVTNTQYRQCLEAGVCQDMPCLTEPGANAPDQPAGCMTWQDCEQLL